ncbi:MAG: DUF4303 domain-containing protein [Deltaproteobacteria bacterium]|nr:DUF4303 domain-containing protein [Deltaproteobacteria bacterium]
MSALSEALADAVRSVWAGLDTSDLYGLALFTDPAAEFIRVTAFSRAGLRATAEQYASRGGDLAVLADELRWSPADSPRHCLGDDAFAEVDALLSSDALEGWDRVGVRFGAVFEALRTLDGEGLFGKGAAREGLTLHVMQGDQSDRSRWENAERLNPPAVLARLRTQLQLSEEVGVSEGLGSAYQISALDYAGGTLLATGSGGEFFVWRRDQEGWVAVDDVPSGGARWAAALTPDGAGVYASDGNTIQTAPIRKRLRGLRDFHVAPNQVRCMAWSPGGGTLFVGTWGPSLALDWTGAIRWETGAVGPIAWASDEVLAVGTDDGVDWLDGATGEVRRRMQTGGCPGALAVSGESAAVAWGGGFDGTPVSLQIIRDGDAVPCDVGGLREVKALAWSPDGQWLAAACFGGDVAVWHPDGRRARSWRGRHESMGQVVWVDERTVAAAGRDVDRGSAVVMFRMD